MGSVLILLFCLDKCVDKNWVFGMFSIKINKPFVLCFRYREKVIYMLKGRMKWEELNLKSKDESGFKEFYSGFDKSQWWPLNSTLAKGVSKGPGHTFGHNATILAFSQLQMLGTNWCNRLFWGAKIRSMFFLS